MFPPLNPFCMDGCKLLFERFFEERIIIRITMAAIAKSNIASTSSTIINVPCPVLPPPEFDELFPVPVEFVTLVVVPATVGEAVGDALAVVGVGDGCEVGLGLGVGVAATGAEVMVRCFTPVV